MQQTEQESRTVAALAVSGTYVYNVGSRCPTVLGHDCEQNVADVGTKHVGGKMRWTLLGCIGAEAMTGRSELALRTGGETKA